MSVSASTIQADETASARRETAGFHFGATDWAVFVLMLVTSVLIGVFSSVRGRQRATTHEFLLGGRSMPAPAVALSLLGGWVSAISVLGEAPYKTLSHTQRSFFFFLRWSTKVAMQLFLLIALPTQN